MKSKRYLVLSILKQTNESLVCIVQDQYSSKKFISKSIKRNANPIAQHQFHVEVDLLGQLNHSHIPTLVDVFETEQYLTFIETYYKGLNLREYDRKISIKEAHKWLQILLDIFEEIHKHGYLYIDLKPENIIVEKDEIYLIDFDACIEMKEQKVCRASSFNKAPEYDCNLVLDVTSDIYGLGGIIEYIYPSFEFKILAKMCRQKNPRRRIQSLKMLRKMEWIFYNFRKMSIYFICTLSVLLLLRSILVINDPLHKYLQNPCKEQFISAYQYTMHKTEGETRIQDTLYQWIERKWFDSEILNDRECVVFILKQALLSKNITLCSIVLDMIPESIKKECVDLVVMVQVYISQLQTIDSLSIHSYISSIQNKNLSSNQFIEECSILLNVLIECEIILEIDDLKALYTMINSLENQSLKEVKNVLKLYLSYGMVCKEQKVYIQVPIWFKQIFENETTYLEIIRFLGG